MKVQLYGVELSGNSLFRAKKLNGCGKKWHGRVDTLANFAKLVIVRLSMLKCKYKILTIPYSQHLALQSGGSCNAKQEINKIILPNAQETQLENSMNLFRQFPNQICT